MVIESGPRAWDFRAESIDGGFLVLASGFEDRAVAFISKVRVGRLDGCVLVNHDNDDHRAVNELRRKTFCREVRNRVDGQKIREINLNQEDVDGFEKGLARILADVPGFSGDIWLDVSGLNSFAICVALSSLRDQFPTKPVNVVYSSAASYFPTEAEFQRLEMRQGSNVEFLPHSMALEMSEVLLIERFSGHRSKDGANCLAVFAGYDAARSAGVIDSMNPAKLLLLYGEPAGNGLGWRLALSKQLHGRFETARNTATECVSTLDPAQSLAILEKYYGYLFDDYDLTIAPVCSKMQAVASFVFWETYREIQLAFPLPIAYSYERRPIGVGTTYVTRISARSLLFRDQNRFTARSGAG
jgi:hypothetical protein